MSRNWKLKSTDYRIEINFRALKNCQQKRVLQCNIFQITCSHRTKIYTFFFFSLHILWWSITKRRDSIPVFKLFFSLVHRHLKWSYRQKYTYFSTQAGYFFIENKQMHRVVIQFHLKELSWPWDLRDLTNKPISPNYFTKYISIHNKICLKHFFE